MERSPLLPGGTSRAPSVKLLIGSALAACMVLTIVVISAPNQHASILLDAAPVERALDKLAAAAAPSTTTATSNTNFQWGPIKDGLPAIDCSTSVSDDPQFWGDVGDEYTVWCPPHCAAFGDQEVFGTEIFMDDSVICKAAMARGKLGSCNPGKVSFKIVEPIPKYPAGANMPLSVGIKEFVEASSGDEGASATNGTCHQIGIETMPWEWQQWANADPSTSKGQDNIKACLADPRYKCTDTACAQEKAIQKFRWQCSDNQQTRLPSSEVLKIRSDSTDPNYKGECYGKRAFVITDGGQKRMALKLSGTPTSYGEAAPTCNAALAKAAAAITVEAWVNDANPQDGAYVGSIALGDDKSADAGFALGAWKGTWAWSVVGTSSVDSPVPKIARVIAPEYITKSLKGTWTHLAGTYDGSIMKLYVNGKSVGCGGSQNGPISLSTKANLVVGAFKDYGAVPVTTPASGDIDEIRIWGKALAEADFTADHMGKTQGDGKTVPTDLVVYYRFDGQDATATTGCAESGAACALTLHGSTFEVSTSPMTATAPTAICVKS